MEMNFEPDELHQNNIQSQYFHGFAEGSKIAGFLHGLVEGVGGVSFTSTELKDIILTKLTVDMNIELSVIDAEVKLGGGQCDCPECSSEESEMEL